MKKIRLRFPVKTVSLIILCLAGLGLLLYFPLCYLGSCDYFQVKQSKYFSGQNIFKINLRKQAEGLSRIYPDYKKITLRRMLPDKIVADFLPRQPLAVLRLSEDFCLDENSILFSCSGRNQQGLRLPLITGLNRRAADFGSGQRYEDDALLACLRFIDKINKDQKLSEQLKIREVNLANVNDVILFSLGGCKINLGVIGSLDKNFLILQRLSNEIDFDLGQVEYIDLRFKEPAIKYR